MRFYVKVVPGSSREKIEKISNGNYKAWINAPAEKDKANQRLIEVLSEYFNVRKSGISLIGGKTSRIKLIQIEV